MGLKNGYCASKDGLNTLTKKKIKMASVMFLVLSAMFAIVIGFALLLIFKLTNVAKKEVEYLVEPSGSMVTLSYRFKGERVWSYIYEYDSGPYAGKYGEFNPMRFKFHEDGNYEHLKERYTKEKIEKHNENLLALYNLVKRQRQEEERRQAKNVAKRI